MPHRDTHRTSVQRVGATTAEHDGVDGQPRRIAKDRTQVLVIVDALEHRDGPRAVYHIGDAALGYPAGRSEHAAVEMKADRLGHHLGRNPVVGSRIADQVRPEFGEPAVGAEKRQRRERRGQHPLHDQYTLGDHQAFAAGQIRAPVDAVQIAEVVQPWIVGIVDVADDHAVDVLGAVRVVRGQGLSSTKARIKSAATRSVSRSETPSVSSRCVSHS